MVTPLLTTRFFIPPAAAGLVERPRLLARLDACVEPGCRLALVSAPAGFGKTTLISAWVAGLSAAGRQPPVLIAWLSLDEADNDPVTFWMYAISALQTQVEGVGDEMLSLLQQPRPANPESLLPLLVNDLARVGNPLVLILDDLHLIREPSIYRGLAALIEHAPPQFHLLAATRADPPLPLARLRGRGRLIEVRMAELRFSNQETAIYLNQAMRLDVPPEAVDRLNAKTEGWAAGLQMAAIAMQSTAPEREKSAAAFIDGFSGSNRFILDYLLEEVLDRQPPDIVDFLLKTSVLERMCAALCEAVVSGRWPVVSEEHSLPTDHAPAPLAKPPAADHFQLLLEQLDHSNLFIISLDAERRWYRYHHLFADLLRKRLNLVYPGLAEELYKRASGWSERNELLNEAVEYAFLSKDAARAASLVDQAAEGLWRQGLHARLLDCIQRLPEAQVLVFPRLTIYQAAILTASGGAHQAEQVLLRLAEGADAGGRENDLSPSLQARLYAVRAMIAVMRGDTAETVRCGQLALERLSTGADSDWRAYVLVILSNVHMVRGELEAAMRNLKEAIQAGKQCGYLFIVLEATTKLAMELWVHGDLRQAGQYCREGLDYIEQHNLGRTEAAALLLLGWGFLLYEWNDLTQAEACLERAMEICRLGSSKTAAAWASHLRISCLVARGELRAAEEAALEAERVNREGEIPIWLVAGISGLLGGVYLRQGKIAEAEQALRERAAALESALVLKHPYQLQYFILARLLLVRGETAQAANLLERMLAWTTATKQAGWTISVLACLGLAYRSRKDHRRAFESIERALALGEPQGCIQTFLSQGPELRPLLEEAALRGDHRGYAQQLVDAFINSSAGGATPFHAPANQPQHPARVEAKTTPPPRAPLSKREIEVLQLIADGLSNKEIAQRLSVSLRTVKYYTTGIFTKLDVNGRAHAAVRAKELGLIK